MMRIRSTLTDEQAARRFYAEIWPHAAAVVRSARLLARNASEADDLSQETMLKAYESLESLRPGTNAKSWLLTILRHSWIDRFRSRNAHPTVALGDADVPERDAASEQNEDWADPEDILFRFGDADIIDALQQLPDEIRWTLLLVDVEGMPQMEAADVLGVPAGTIKSRAHRGREMLRDALEPRARELGYLGRESMKADERTEQSR
jgi:RNA polymerase sigma-70 factor (ECF subfamily)